MKPPDLLTSRHEDVQAYRGYLICWNVLNGRRWVEKDGQRIAWVESAEAARTAIDQLLD